MTDYSLYTIEEFKPKKKKFYNYGYDKEDDIVVISKDGSVGDVWNINGVRIALPKEPDIVDNLGDRWIPQEYPAELEKIKRTRYLDIIIRNCHEYDFYQQTYVAKNFYANESSVFGRDNMGIV